MVKIYLDLKKILRNRFDKLFCSNKYKIIEFGGVNSWNIYKDAINQNSIIYSFGVGNDISFEKDLIGTYKCKIFLYDPSPTGIATMSLRENNSEFIFFRAVGVAGKSAVISFSPPLDNFEGSFRISDGNNSVVFECFDLMDLLKSNKHNEIDLLKMDIEGFEYEVIDSILSSNINIKQICVEFHHFYDGISIFKTLNYIIKMYKHGYLLIHKNRFDYTFIKRDCFGK